MKIVALALIALAVWCLIAVAMLTMGPDSAYAGDRLTPSATIPGRTVEPTGEIGPPLEVTLPPTDTE